MKIIKNNGKWLWALWIVIMVIFMIFMLVGIPIIINTMYIKNNGYITVWDGSSMLGFYGAVLSFLGSALLGVLALWQNDRLNKINMKLSNQQYKPILTFTWIPSIDIEDQKEKHRTFFRDFEQNSDKVMINNGYESRPKNKPNVILVLNNIGLGPAFNIKIFMHKLKSIEGVESLKNFRLSNIENFYDKINFEDYEYYENKEKLNDAWQIYTDFNLGISEENNKLNLGFSFKDVKEDIHSIIEFQYNNIDETEFTQYMYIGYEKETVSTVFLPISKVIVIDN